MPEATTSSAINAGCLAQARAIETTIEPTSAARTGRIKPWRSVRRPSSGFRTVSTAVVTTKSAPIAIVPQP